MTRFACRATAWRKTSMESVKHVTMPVTIVAGSPALMVSTVSAGGFAGMAAWIRWMAWVAVRCSCAASGREVRMMAARASGVRMAFRVLRRETVDALRRENHPSLFDVQTWMASHHFAFAVLRLRKGGA